MVSPERSEVEQNVTRPPGFNHYCSSDLLRLALGSAQMGCWQWDLASATLTADARAAALLGIAESEATAAEHFLARVHDDDRAGLERQIASVRRMPGDFSCEVRIAGTNGGVRRVLLSGSAPADETGSTMLVGVATDVTARQRTESVDDIAPQERQLLQLIIDTAPFSIIYIDHETRYRFVNDRYAARFGRQPGDILGKSVREVVGESLYATIGPKLQEALAGQPVRYELAVDTKRGERRFQVVYVPDKDDRGRVRGLVAVHEDITERKEAEDAMRGVALFPEENPSPVLRISRDGTLLYANPASFALLSVWACQPGGAAPDVLRRAVREALDEGRVREIEVPIGEALLSFVITPLTDRDYANLYGRDITDRQRAETQLRERVEEIEKLMDVVPVAIWLAEDPDCRRIVGNRMANAFYEAEENENVSAGPSPGESVAPRRFFQEGRELRPEELPMQVAAACGTDVRNAEIDVLMPSGRRITIWGSATPLRDAAGRVRGCLGAFLDITERKRFEQALSASEERFRTLADNIAQLAWMTDEAGAIFWYNKRWFDYTGTEHAEVEGWGWQKLHHPDHLDRVVEKYSHCLRSGEPWEDTFPLRGRDGEYRWFLSRAVPIRDASGKVLRWFGTNTDVTEQLEVQTALASAKAAADAANRAKSQFLASMSHELRTPMNAILGMTELALGEPLSPTLRDYLQTTKESADLLLELLNDILDFSRIEAGRLELEATPFDPLQHIEQVVKTLAFRGHEKGVELICDLPDALPSHVVGDPLRLRQVLINLVGNAVKFTAQGEVVVRLTAHETPPDSVTLELAISDTGIGIAPEDQERIFAPFVQADASTTRHYGGSGLGLAISRRLVDMMGGRIWFKSQPGSGTTFYVSLTLPTAPRQAERAEPPPLSRDILRDLPVLVVSASLTARQILLQTLASWSMRADASPDVPTALARIHEASAAGQAYRLVLTDAALAGIDGFKLVEWLQNDPGLAGPALVMLSPSDRQKVPTHCSEPRTICLDKPISRSALLRGVIKGLGLEEHDVRELSGHVATVSPVVGRPLRVLLVEDMLANQKLVTRILEKRGHRVEVAGDGRQALEQLQRASFDAVLMDVQMPVMDGFEATEAIRALSDPQRARIPIIAMTAHAMKGDAERCLAVGMTAYLSKPINSREMIVLLESLCDGNDQ